MKFKFLLFILISVPLLLNNVSAQDDRIDDLGFEDAPIQEESNQYFAIGVGYSANFFMPDFDELNKTVTSVFEMDELSGSVYMNSIEGFVYTFFIPNTKLTLFTSWGSKLTEKEVTVNGNNFNRSFEYQVQVQGGALEYGIVITKSFAIVPGIGFGSGNLILDAFQGDNFDWGDIQPVGSSDVWLKRAQAGYFVILPRLSVEWAVSDFVMLRAGASYSYASMGDWKYDRTAGLSNVPEDIKASGIAFNIGLALGLFNF